MGNSSGYIRRLSLREKHIQDQQSAADHYARIRHVEGGPMVGAKVEFQEVGHASRYDAVEGVARRAAQNQRQPPLRRGVDMLYTPHVSADEDHRDHGHHDQREAPPLEGGIRSEEHTSELQSL